MIDPKFKDAEVGDWVFTIKGGWVRVTSTYCSDEYPIRVSRRNSFTLEGKTFNIDCYPSAWTYNPFDKNDRPPVTFTNGEVIAVRDRAADPWRYDVFVDLKFAAVFKYKCVRENWRYARELNKRELG